MPARYLAVLYRAVAALARDIRFAAAAEFKRSLEVRAPLATGPWMGWYAGDKKANWPMLLAKLHGLFPRPAARKL